MEYFLIAAVGCLVAYYGGTILEKLPKTPASRQFRYVSAPYTVGIEIDYFHENDFEVGFVDDWKVGRSFSMGGATVLIDGHQPEDMRFLERTAIEIGPSPEWFTGSCMGSVRAHDGRASTIYIALPYQIAFEVLAELRRDQKQKAWVSLSKWERKDGKIVYGVYSFGLQKREWD